MKIVHVAISNPFVDNWGYQENILPKYLQKLGTQNYIIASSTDFPYYLKKTEIEEIKSKGNDYVIDEIIIKRIPTRKISTSLYYTIGLKQALEAIKPDVIFHHNFNCTSLSISARYARKHKIPMVVDNHADTINMTKNKLWAWFYYKVLIFITCKLYQKQIFKAYGVTHSRCAFIHDYYGLSYKKIDFLPIGADVDLSNTISSRVDIRRRYNITDNDFVIVSGGKMGKIKGTDSLIRAVEEIHGLYPNSKLVLFGSFESEEDEVIANSSHYTTYVGWCDRIKTLELLKMADVACWPIHHTTLIEDAVSVCTPIINRKTPTSEHLINGNGLWIEKGTKEEIKNALLQLLTQDDFKQYEMSMACSEMKKIMSYNTIAQKLLEDISTFCS